MEIIQMPPKARVLLEQYAGADLRTTFKLSWSAVVAHRSDEDALRVAREQCLREHANKIAFSLGKDNVIVSVHNEFDGVSMLARSIAFTPADFEMMITSIYTAGLMQGRKEAPL